MTRLLASLVLCLGLCAAIAARAEPAVALHYGSNAPLADLKVFDIAVVEPGHGNDPVHYRNTTGSELFAYVSVAEVYATRPYYRDIPAAWKLARNDAWESEVIDQTPAEWPEFFATRVVGPLWQQGYRGFFLDTLDSYRLAKQFDEAAQQAGLVRVIETLHQRFPGIQIIQNRGFEIVERVRDKIFMVAAESLYKGWNAAARRYEDIAPADREWLLGQLRSVHERYHLPVLVIDYVPPQDREQTRQTAQRIKDMGFIPWVTDSAMQTMGVGSVELAARRVLFVYDSDESPALNYANAHRFLQMPLNHMGYVVDYADVRAPLPEGILRDRYAGVVTWFSGFIPETYGRRLSLWLQARIAEGMPLAMMGDFGMAPDKALAERLGIQTNAPPHQGALRIVTQHPMMGFETAPQQPERQFEPVRLTSAQQRNALPLMEFRDQRGQSFVAGALMPWGGFILEPYALVEIPGTEDARWVIDPFAFITRALSLPPLPVPDTTTENGRRLFFSHVDGDGFPSRSELPGSPIAAEVLLKEIFEKYKVPQTMSVIEAEVAPHGIYPQLSPQLEDIARRMFRLPHVEVASHTYSHPFLWDLSVRHGLFSENADAAVNLSVPGYTMDLTREIVGSTEYINRRLAPPDKPVKILLWSGDTAPNARALEITERAGLLNMNGGDTFITRANPSLTAVGALGIQKDGRLQVYAPITNENIYTNLWHGPYYGFERAIESFQMTDAPRRIKPVGIYYHVYSASKRAGLTALHKVYRWALSQPLHPIFASEFIRKVQDFHTFAIARDGQGWRLRGDGALRTVRLPAELGVPSLAASQGVAGFRQGAEGLYVHLTGAAAWLQTTAPRTTPATGSQRPYLRDANARLDSWNAQADGRSVDFTLKGFAAPLQFSLGAAHGCLVTANNHPLTPTRPSSPSTASAAVSEYEIRDAAAQIHIRCTAR